MATPMRQKARQVKDKALICAMLDRMDTIYVGMRDEPAPYVVPLNFGYEFDDERLTFYFHCAKEGYKLELLKADPHVSVTAAQFISYAGGSVRGHLHDFRSVMARGIASRIDPQAEGDAFERAHRLLLEHNHRQLRPGDAEAAQHIFIWRIVCRAEDVTAKAEIVPKCVLEVPFLEPAASDNTPLDESHIL